MKDQLVGMFLVVESTGHEHYRTGQIAAAVGNCYLIQFDKMEESEAPPLPPMELCGAVHARGAEPDLCGLRTEAC